MDVPCSTKIIKKSPSPTMNCPGTSEGKGCNLFVMSLMQGWRMNETNTEYNLLLVFYWSIFKMKYFSRINNGKGKHPTLDQFYLFSFRVWKRQSWWTKCNVGLNPYSFNVLFSNNFSKWINVECCDRVELG